MGVNGFKLGHCVRGERRDPGAGRAGVPLYELYAAWGRPPCLICAEKSGGQEGALPNVAHSKGLASAGKPCGDERGAFLWNITAPPEGSSDRESFYWYMNARPEPESRDGAELAGRLRVAALRVLEEALGSEVTFSVVRPYSRTTREGDLYRLCPEYRFDAKPCEEGAVPAVAARKGFVVFTRDPLRALFHSAVLWAVDGTMMPVLQVDPAGRVVLYDGFQSKVGSLLAQLKRLHIYCANTTFRDNYLGVPVERRPAVNTFAVDTEYVDGKDLYELGLLNLANPYASLSMLLKGKTLPPQERLREMGLTEKDFDALSVHAFEAQALFMCGAVDPSGPRPRLLYFSASQDISWASDLIAGKDAAVCAEDVAAAAARLCPRRGLYVSDSTAVNLDMLYGMYSGAPPYGENMRHRAFPDALMLGEIICGMLQSE